MKKILLSLACVASVFSMSAQRASDTEATFFDSSKPEKLVRLGVRAGLNVASLTGDLGEGMDSKCGFVGGISADFAIMESFYINSGVFISMNGAKYDEDGYELTFNPMYIKIPVMASYRYNFNENLQWQLNFGPYFAFGVSGDAKAKEDGEEYKIDFFGDDDDQFGGKRFDMGLGIGTGVTWDKIFFGIQYDFGMTKVVKDVKGKNSTFSVSVGYNF